MSLLAERFELAEQVGSGGFGAVYRASDRFDGNPVAVKLLHTKGAVDQGRFQREAALLAELQHPCIVRYVAHGTSANGQSYLVMEWLEGQTLAARLRKGWLALGDIVTLAQRVVEGLAAASQRGVIHRDVKPENIFLPLGRIADAKLLDFGLARRVDEAEALTRSGAVLGTPLYMSPEQARGVRSLDMSSDIFSLGSVLFECLCGVSPFESDTALATLAKICFEQPARIGSLRTKVPESLVQLIEAMLQKVSSERPSYAALVAELRRIEAGATESEISLDLRTDDLVLSGGNAASLRPRVQQRVLSAVFAGQTEEYSDQQLEQILDVLLDRHGARCERLIDGSLVLLLERFHALHEQTIAAAHCALTLRELLPDCPIVISTARAVLEGGLPMGSLLENGARLLGETPQGVIRLDDASVSLLEARFEVRGTGGRYFLERMRFGGEAPRTLLGRLTPFVGRERELGQIELLFRECVEECVTRAVLVTAAPGAGKSRLRFELVQRLRKDGAEFTLLTGAGDSLRAGAPFSTLAPALRASAGISQTDSLVTKREKLRDRVAATVPQREAQRVAEFLGEMLGFAFPATAGSELELARSDPQLLAKRILTSWLEWVAAECRQKPVVVLIDDLHWSDQASLQFLEASMRQSDQPLLLVAFARPEVHEKFHRLWSERELLELRLPKLNARACERLLAAIPEAELALERRKWLIDRADGNPFYLEELIRSGLAGQPNEALPDSILAAIQARLDALGEDAKLLLRVASVFGTEFSAEGVTALLGPQARRFDLRGWLTVLVERELVFSRGDAEANEYGFRHALVRDAAYALLTESERSLAHRLAGDWLEAQEDPVEPAVLAEHFDQGGARDRAAQAYAKAVARAYETNSLAEVVRMGERAVASGLAGQALGEVSAMVAHAFGWQAQPEASYAWAARAKELLVPPAPGWWRASMVLAEAMVVRGALADAERVSEEMLAALVPSTAISETAIALSAVARTTAVLAITPLSRRLLAAANTLTIPEHLPRARGWAESARMMIAGFDGDLATATSRGRSALTYFQNAGAVYELSLIVNDLGYLLVIAGAYGEAENVLREALSSPSTTSLDRLMYQQNLGLCALRTARWQEARDLLEASAQGLAHTTVARDQAFSLAHLAEAQLALGQVDDACCSCEQALAISELAQDAWTYTASVQSRVLLARGQTQEALEASEHTHVAIAECTYPDLHIAMCTARTECLLAAGESESADQLLSSAHCWLRERASKIGDPAVRRVFLTGIPDNLRVLSMAESRLGLSFPF